MSNYPTRPALDIENYTGDEVKDLLIEAIHQGLDGWTEHEQEVITAFLSDILNGIDTIREG